VAQRKCSSTCLLVGAPATSSAVRSAVILPHYT
jgi:hypothetical protein